MNIHILEIVFDAGGNYPAFATPDEELFLDTVSRLRELNRTRPHHWRERMQKLIGQTFGGDPKDFRTYSIPHLFRPLPLTPKELALAEEVTKGTPRKEIVHVLKISIRTYNWHRANIMKKLNISTSAELALKMRESGHA